MTFIGGNQFPILTGHLPKLILYISPSSVTPQLTIFTYLEFKILLSIIFFTSQIIASSVEVCFDCKKLHKIPHNNAEMNNRLLIHLSFTLFTFYSKLVFVIYHNRRGHTTIIFEVRPLSISVHYIVICYYFQSNNFFVELGIRNLLLP